MITVYGNVTDAEKRQQIMKILYTRTEKTIVATAMTRFMDESEVI